MNNNKYKEQMAALTKFSMQQLQNFMVDCLGYSEEDLDDWPDKEAIADNIIDSSNIAHALMYLSYLNVPPEARIFEPLFQMDKYIMVNPGNGGAYNVAVMENEHIIDTNKYARLFVESPGLLSACEAALRGDMSLLEPAIQKVYGNESDKSRKGIH